MGECFGKTMEHSPVNIYYHGISTEMIFQGTSFRLSGPLSTTTAIEVARRFAKRQGMVVDIKNTKGGQMLFNCEPWSCYTEEYERLFIGGIQPFTFLTIHDIPKLQDYELLIRPMAMLSKMVRGWPNDFYLVSSSDVEFLEKLIESVLFPDIPLMIGQKTADYIQRLFRNLVNNIHKIEINIFMMNIHKEYAKQNFYGYKNFKSIFFGSSETINFTKIIKVFLYKLESFEVYNEAYGAFKPSISLNNSFIEEIMASIQTINESVSLRSSFKEFVIVEPKQSITDFMQQQQALFNEHGWTLKKTKYHHVPRNATSNNALSIAPL